ncbi:MAG: helix-hairpin-helix domain-containing protein [Gemmatimonadetes bacterium]|nr:helix-hairpin-helix domain-containing protein [Gemmatimonadota bacterium]NNM05205.1 helix-hairpin-helix domain-containing protein [Gemmatimonadota bacterium]
MTPLESRSLVRGGTLLLALSILRLATGSAASDPPVLADGDSNLYRLLDESIQVRDEESRRSAPLGPGETVDPNRSTEEELDRLPGIGPATAKAWVKTREREGGFWELKDLLAVPGVGPATLEKVTPHLEFSAGVSGTVGVRRRGRDLESKRAGGSSGPRNLLDRGPPAERPVRIDMNRASLADLQSLPGIGPTLAERIIENRRKEGFFLKPEDLLRVRGIGRATLDRIRELILPPG